MLQWVLENIGAICVGWILGAVMMAVHINAGMTEDLQEIKRRDRR